MYRLADVVDVVYNTLPYFLRSLLVFGFLTLFVGVMFVAVLDYIIK